MNKEKILKQLQEMRPGYPNQWKRSMEEPTLAQWQAAGRPYIWEIAAKSENITLLSDSAYGKLAIIVGDEIEDTGNNFVKTKDNSFVGLSEYYGMSKPQLFKHAV